MSQKRCPALMLFILSVKTRTKKIKIKLSVCVFVFLFCPFCLFLKLNAREQSPLTFSEFSLCLFVQWRILPTFYPIPSPHLSNTYLPPTHILSASVFYKMTDCADGSTQNYFSPTKMVSATRVCKFKAPPKEMSLSFSIGAFLTNYDVTNRKQ